MYDVAKCNRRSKEHETLTVRSGPGCSRVLQGLREDRAGVFGGVSDITAAGTPTTAVLAGKYRGATICVALLQKPTDQPVESGDWKARAYAMRQRPSEHGLLKAYDTCFGCRRIGGAHPTCSNVRCPRCWLNTSSLDEQEITCARFKQLAPLKASSGEGRWRGGDIRDIS